MASKTIPELTAGTISDGAELLEISQLSATVSITATTISADGDSNSYIDSGSGFVAAGFAAGNRVRVTGFTGDVANNIFTGVVTALTTTTMTIGGTDGDVIVDDAAGESVTITKWETHRLALSDLNAFISDGLMRIKGAIDCSADPNYPVGSAGDLYYVSVAGHIGGGSGASVDVGDAIVAIADNAGGTQAAVGASWIILEHNLVGAVVGAGVLLAVNNLGDVDDPDISRANIGAAPARLTVETEVGATYSLVAADAGKHKRFTNAAAVVTVSAGEFTVGDCIRLTDVGGGLTLDDDGGSVTLNSRDNALTSAGAMAVIEIECVAADEFDVLGDVVV